MITPGGLMIPPALHVSFQRYARPPENVITKAPSSLGALPVGIAQSGNLVLPLAPDEAFWIGLEVTQADAHMHLAVRFQSPGEPALDALSGETSSDARARRVAVPPHQRIDGIALAASGFRSFARTVHAREDGATALLELVTTHGVDHEARSHPTRVVIVDYLTFETMTGRTRPAPLDPGAKYQGWLLP